jgi:hypothetical protein
LSGSSARREVAAALVRSLDWLLALRDADGRIVCREHAVEHTGKSACAAITACVLWKETGDERYRNAARRLGARLVANLVREGDSPCHTFRPGRHDPFNCSNSVIDGGACSDALAHLVTEMGSELSARERESFAAASLLHARTYLRYAVLDKGVPAQRAWGMTGLAGAFALGGDAELGMALSDAVEMLAGVQHGDGSYPYHPAGFGAPHPGASDVSAFYQSRVTGFITYALERAGRDPAAAELRAPLVRGLDFLCALAGPDGIKVGLVEAKPWYWGAEYEVASHPFDAYALARGHALFGTPRYARAAAAAFRAWAAHIDGSGAPRSHLPGPGRGRSYQCPAFWAAHACWIARALDELETCLAVPAPAATERGADRAVAWFPDAALGRIEDGAVVAWVRGARPGSNVLHGSPRGAGLLRVLRRSDGEELLARAPFAPCTPDEAGEAEWSGRAGRFAPLRGVASGWRAVGFSAWLARVHLRAGRPGAALRAPLSVLRRGALACARSGVSSAFDLAPEAAVLDDGIGLTVALRHRGLERPGARPAALVRREFRVDGGGLLVAERVLEPGRVRRLAYTVPAAARDVRYPAVLHVAYRLC